MIQQTYQVVVAQSGKQDIKDMKKYIIETFKYRELGENFSNKIKIKSNERWNELEICSKTMVDR